MPVPSASRALPFLALIAVMLSAGACDGDPDGDGGLTDAARSDSGRNDGGGPDTGTDASTICNSLDGSIAPLVTKTFSDTAAPAATGGTIMEGRYFRSTWVEYLNGIAMPPGTPPDIREVIRFSATRLDVSGTDAMQWSFDYTVTGPDLTTSGGCGLTMYPGAQLTVVSPDELLIYGPGVNGGTFEVGYTRQP